VSHCRITGNGFRCCIEQNCHEVKLDCYHEYIKLEEQANKNAPLSYVRFS